MQFPVYDCFVAPAGLSYIQIIHCPTLDHWVTVEICVDEQVRIFDSALTKPSYEVKKQIASIIPTKQNKIDFKLQQQKIQLIVAYLPLPLQLICAMELIRSAATTAMDTF